MPVTPPVPTPLVLWAFFLQGGSESGGVGQVPVGLQTKSPPRMMVEPWSGSAPAAVLNVEGLHPADGQLRWGLHAAQS